MLLNELCIDRSQHPPARTLLTDFLALNMTWLIDQRGRECVRHYLEAAARDGDSEAVEKVGRALVQAIQGKRTFPTGEIDQRILESTYPSWFT